MPTIQEILESAAQHRRAGNLAQAEQLCRRALDLWPENSEAWHSYGLVALTAGQYQTAFDFIGRAIDKNPGVATYYNNMGLVLTNLGRGKDAIACFENALKLQPNFAAAWNNLGNAFKDQNHVDETIAAYRKAIALDPNIPEAHNNLGNILQAARLDLDESIDHYRQALRLRPNYASAHRNFGSAMLATGKLPEAIAAYDRALQIAPNDASIASNRIYALNFDPDLKPPDLARELAIWNERYCRPVANLIIPHGNQRVLERPLRIGYVSPDFRNHVVGHNLLPLLRNHDQSQFHIYCYASVVSPDDVTRDFWKCVHNWRDIIGASDDQAAIAIRTDGIDILVDLSLHTADNRLGIFARQPAPVQISYLGYAGGSGLETIRWRFSDPYLDPPDADPALFNQNTFRLPKTYWCYQPFGPVPDPDPSPASTLTETRITFGSMNNSAKLSPITLKSWRRILDAIPDSRLILFCAPGSHRQDLSAALGEGRVEFIGFQSFSSYIQTFNRLHISLDPFPYNGGITTCDSLIMGVPVITLAGQTPIARAGCSILTNAGAPELIASDIDAYIQTAVDLAHDAARRGHYRATLPTRLRQSPLMDAKCFAHDVEQAYRKIWRDWCNNYPANP